MFAIVNVMLITACNFHLLFTNINSMPDDYRAGYSSFQMIAVLVNLMAIGIALSIRYVMRQNEKKQKVVEAEGRTSQAHGGRTGMAEEPDKSAFPVQHAQQHLQPGTD